MEPVLSKVIDGAWIRDPVLYKIIDYTWTRYCTIFYSTGTVHIYSLRRYMDSVEQISRRRMDPVLYV